jgi:glycosyltransferase involved in cell wall biosynthesis
MNKPLLSIAIPTYNRAILLDKLLSKLLPQIFQYRDIIEIIISDNASEDNTQDIIKKYKLKNKSLQIIDFLQSQNTGYYGNFKKCRELSNGHYFWILSDNEHISDNVIPLIVKTIKSNKEFACLYLKNNKSSKYSNDFQVYDTTFSKLTDKLEAYKLTLISAVIMLNLKDEDEILFNQFMGNSFLGFLFLCKILSTYNKVIVIEGYIYNSAHAFVTFDIFNSWTNDISECVEYLKNRKVFDDHLKNRFIESYLKNNVHTQVKYMLANKKIHNNKYKDKRAILNNLYYYYSDIPYFKRVFYTFYKKPLWFLYIKYNVSLSIRKLINRFQRLLVYLKKRKLNCFISQIKQKLNKS